MPLTILPWVWYASIYLHAWRASQFLGHWPSYGNPDPKELPAGFGSSTVWMEYTLPWAVGLLLLLLWIAAIYRVNQWQQGQWSIVHLTTASFVGLFIMAWLDPGGVMNWFMD